MDSITQAVLGASIGQAMLGEKAGNKAAIAGAIIATIPDLDVLLLPFYDSLQRISIHRGLSHSILFSIVGAFIIAYLLSKFKFANNFTYKKLWLFTWLALFTHMLLDTFTSYGTQLFLPFSDYRFGFDSINVVDPVYTVPLALGLFLSIYFKGKKPKYLYYNTIGILVSTIYLLFTLGIKQHVLQQFKHQFAGKNISVEKWLTIPVSFGSINWYGVAKTNEGLYIGKYSNVKNNGIEFEFFPTNDYLLNDLNPWLVNRMKWFSKDFYTVMESDGIIRFYNMQCDMQGIRYFGNEKAPTAFYFEINPQTNGNYQLKTGMHPKK